MKEIASDKNPLIKKFKKLHKKKYREQEQKYLVEGFHLIEEAQKAQAEIEWIIVNQKGMDLYSTWLQKQNEEQLIFVHAGVLETLSELSTNQGIVAVVKMLVSPLPIFTEGSWLLLDQVQDPGNVGTMIRTADAAGLTGVILGGGSADLYSEKVLRAMQGSNFHLAVHQTNLTDVRLKMKTSGLSVFGTALNSKAINYKTIAPVQNYGLIMGNEGQGVSAALLELTTENLFIPLHGAAESLNVAVAAGILMYQLQK